MKKAELHLHTFYSNCSNLSPEAILKQAIKKRIDILAITDHNTIKGALELKKVNKHHSIKIIIAEEIQTDKGEVLAYYLKKEIKPASFKEVIDKIKSQNALVSLAHPYTTGFFRKSNTLSQEDLKLLDGIEILNGRNLFTKENQRAQALAKKYSLTPLSGSDAHFINEIGKCPTYLEKNLRYAIKNNKTKPRGNTKNALYSRLKSFFYSLSRARALTK